MCVYVYVYTHTYIMEYYYLIILQYLCMYHTTTLYTVNLNNIGQSYLNKAGEKTFNIKILVLKFYKRFKCVRENIIQMTSIGASEK